MGESVFTYCKNMKCQQCQLGKLACQPELALFCLSGIFLILKLNQIRHQKNKAPARSVPRTLQPLSIPTPSIAERPSMVHTEAKHILFALVVLFSVSSASGQAHSFRCKNDLVNLGDSKSTVLQRCGEPVLKDNFCKPVEATISNNPSVNSTVVNVNTCQKVDDWTYNPGRGQFMTSLQFESGKLVSIKYGDRVN